MRRLYPILIILLLAACDRGPNSQNSEQLRPTIPPEWLTKPPTPAITRANPSQVATRSKPIEITPSPIAVSTMLEQSASPTAEPTRSTGFDLLRLFARQWSVSARPGVPDEVASTILAMVADNPDKFLWVEPGSLPTDITITIEGGEPLSQWIYVVAAPFPTVEDAVTEAELRDLWQAPERRERQLTVNDNAAALLTERWGKQGASVAVVDPATLADTLWKKQPSITILPFHRLNPDLKVLELDGESPLSANFSADSYLLTVNIGVEGEQEAIDDFLAAWDGESTNRDPEKLTRVAMTGVTALVRATATQMEAEGVLTPAADVGPLLRGADIAHISNEVSFAPDCPEPSPIGGTSFCSQDEYFALIEDLGTDLIELTGNHLNDWGTENLLRTIDMYEEAGMDYFGGGRDEADAGRVAIVEHHGNRIAFVGCNSFGPSYAWANESLPGSRACGPDFLEQIKQLHNEGYVVIATQQYAEYYQYPPTPDQETDFREIAEAGAAAVSGSQGHHAQGFDFHDGAYIHYGLGNLFFDQMDMLGTRQTFVDTYAIYDGRLINVDLWTGLIEDYFLPREMTVAEREQALESVFQASGW